MKILRPCPHEVAENVEAWGKIKSDAKDLRELVNHGEFEGRQHHVAAIAHAQVSEEPMDFFVLHKDLEEYFGTWCVINLRIRRYGMGVVTSEEGCMSFPHRAVKNVERYALVDVEYKVPSKLGSLKTKVMRLEGLPAFIAQHEYDHARGKNIYYKYKSLTNTEKAMMH